MSRLVGQGGKLGAHHGLATRPGGKLRQLVCRGGIGARHEALEQQGKVGSCKHLHAVKLLRAEHGLVEGGAAHEVAGGYHAVRLAHQGVQRLAQGVRVCRRVLLVEGQRHERLLRTRDHLHRREHAQGEVTAPQYDASYHSYPLSRMDLTGSNHIPICDAVVLT